VEGFAAVRILVYLVLHDPNIDQLPDRGLAQEKILAAQILANFLKH
jgi:hypothetical protein